MLEAVLGNLVNVWAQYALMAVEATVDWPKVLNDAALASVSLRTRSGVLATRAEWRFDLFEPVDG